MKTVGFWTFGYFNTQAKHLNGDRVGVYHLYINSVITLFVVLKHYTLVHL